MNISQPSSRVAKVAFLVGDVARDRNQLSALKSSLADFSTWPTAEVQQLVEGLSRDSATHGVDLALETVLQALAMRPLAINEWLPALQHWYRRMPPDSAVRNYILRLMAMGGTVGSLEQFAANVVDDPPEHAASLGLAFAPLVNSSQTNLQSLFPRLLDGVQHLSMAAAILDIANHAYSEGKLDVHPGAARVVALHALLGQFVEKMSEFEAEMQPSRPLASVQQVVGEAVALVVSLSRSLALIGDPQSLPNLRRALELKHRRIRAEVAGALAQLGDSTGVEALIALAQWPIVRQRALAYADELGVLEQIDPRYRTDAARAESQLAAWLAEPTQFGLAPAQLELYDERELYWPGYDEIQSCYLFRFTYPTAQGNWRNIGIAGPATQATSALLEGLPAETIYALFAGWQTTHEDVYEIESRHLSEQQRGAIARQQSALADQGFADIQIAFIGRFFGDQFAVATARKAEGAGHLIWGEGQTSWLADADQRLTSDLAYAIFKGQKLLHSFNPEFGRPDRAQDL